MQHSCLSVVEITEHCNLRCPVCYAESGPEKQNHRTLAEVEAMFDAIVANETEPDVVQLSGGEPTLHPDFFAILDAAKTRPIRHLMINTNGLRIAREPEFVAQLAAYKPGIEIYLQFDSLHDNVLQQMRGADLAEIHERALTNLEAHGISTTLVMTVKRGVNDEQIGEVIQHGLQYRCVRGVTLQPVSDVGRNLDFEAQRHRLTISEVRRRVAEQSGVFTLDDIVPVPCNPDTLAMGYAVKLGGEVLPLTRHLGPEALLAGPRNTIVFERMDEHAPAIKEAVFKLFSTNHSPVSQANCLSALLCCLPTISAPDLGYENVFRVLIVQFMDAANLDLRALKKSCVHFAQPDGRLIPFEAYNLFYRGGALARTQVIQAEIEQATARRRAVPGPARVIEEEA